MEPIVAVESHHHLNGSSPSTTTTTTTEWEGYVEWRNRAAIRGKHGGFRAATFVLVVEVLENLAFLANASNLVLYLLHHMHLTPSDSANGVTNFMGTAFLLALLGGFLSDAFFTSYQIYIASALVEFLGLIILTVQAFLPSLRPPTCTPHPQSSGASSSLSCLKPTTLQSAILYLGLYLAAIGVGGIKGALPTHGAEQFDESTAAGRIQRSTFFNYFVFCLSAGGLIAVTLVVWVEDNKGWKWGFFIATMSILLSIPVFLSGSPFYRTKIPSGSPLTTISKVVISATLNGLGKQHSTINNYTPTDQFTTTSSIEKGVDNSNNNNNHNQPAQLTQTLRFLNRAVEPNPSFPRLQSTTNQVEQVKIVLKILPIFASTVILNCCLAQLSTFSVQQAATMDTTLGTLSIPPASLPVFPILIIMFIAPLYDHLILPFARRLTKTESGVSHLQRIATGLILSVVAMAVAALVEIKRKNIARNSGLLDGSKPLPATFLWIGIQYALLGSADLFTLAGMLEFFFTEAPSSMRSLATALSFASLAIGYYLSSVIVEIVNSVTGSGRGGHHHSWLSGPNLNHYRLDSFYWLLCGLSSLNFLNFLFWAWRYKYTSKGSLN